MATSAPFAPRPAPPAAPVLQVHDETDARRRAVEAFIQAVYHRRYGARITRFAPTLVALWHEGCITAAAGYRAASTGPLFLERYLPEPVERLLATPAPPRRGIVEVGHLAAGRAGEGRRLVLMLAAHLATLDCEWVVSTLTAELRQLFVRIGVVPLTLGAADPARLGTEAGDWGSYYDHAPVVLAGHLPRAMRHIDQYSAATGANR
ncbi:thermostable hemolysin [Aquincola sp. MAHUQ-54]|uniref:Thermostable hemolysin n=1 Tax=Aquincola agrisoli TaxID=3119538 RepID=A0AAW9QBN7_9BURK